MSEHKHPVSWPGWIVKRRICGQGSGSLWELQREDGRESATVKYISVPRNASETGQLLSQGRSLEDIAAYYEYMCRNSDEEFALSEELKPCRYVALYRDMRKVRAEDGLGFSILLRMEHLLPIDQCIREPEEAELLKLGRQICLALEDSSRQGLLHGRITPRCVFRDDKGDYQLGGFAGEHFGDLGDFRAPEVAESRFCDTRADVYALGLTLYWLLNDRQLPGKNRPAPKNGSEKLKSVVMKAIASNPEERYQTPEEMRAALEAIGTPKKKKKPRTAIIAAAVLGLILTVISVGFFIGRLNRKNQALEESLNASQDAQALALEQEATRLVAQAQALADSYDYDAAITLLDTFSGDKSQYKTILDALNSYTQAKTKIKPIDDPNTIPNLSFHCLIADPARAFTDKDWGESYNQNYVTIDEFSKILDQLYANGYVLVDFDSFIVETVGEDGKIIYSTQPIYLPEGKKPIMLTETLVNYELFTIDSDGDMEADKGGDGFASKLIVDANGKIVNEYVDANGNVLYGAYDLVPILEAFIEEHPDFSYRGARAILAVTGEDGVFGYRTMLSAKDKKGEDYYNSQVEGAKKIAQALRDAGYTIACYTYGNVDYSVISATKIQEDLDNWKKEVKPALGDVSILVYAKISDIGNYEGSIKYNVLKDFGFRCFISSANVPYADVTVNYIRQSRIMVTGQQMIVKPEIFSQYFTAKDVLNDQRGN